MSDANGAQQPFQWPAGKRAAVSLTFDDGRPSQIDRGVPILDASGLKGTFYVSPQNIEKRLHGWIAAARAGHEIGNHTMTHPCSGNYRFARAKALEDLDLDRMARELDDAQEAIEAKLGVRPATFAYPCGQTTVGRGANARSYVPLVAERFLIGRGWADRCYTMPALCDPARVLAVSLEPLSLDDLKALVEETLEEAGWLIRAGPDVGPRRARQVVQMDILQTFCELLAGQGEIWTDTVAAIGRHVVESQGSNRPTAS